MLQGLLMICGCICAVYGITLYIYTGFRLSFLVMWLFTSGFFFMMASAVRYYLKNPKKIPLWLTTSLVTTLFAGLAVFLAAELFIFMGAAVKEQDRLDYVIVLGARVNPDGVSRSLRQRLDRAAEYIEKNPDTYLVLSGGQGSDEPMSEAQAMAEYLVAKGIAPRQLILEDRSTNTTENVAFSKDLIEQHQEWQREQIRQQLSEMAPGPFIIAEEKPVQIGILTSDFHIFRAKKIAQKAGISDIHHVKAPSDLILLPHMCIRECFAILKDQLMGNM